MSRGNVILLLLLAASQRALLETANNGTKTDSWYATGSVDDDSFSPKSISELFTTEKTFSTANPIIVSHSTTSGPPIEVVSQVAVKSSSSTPVPYSMQPPTPSSPYSTQPIEEQTAQPTRPNQVQFVQSAEHPQSVAVQTIQPPITLNSQSQPRFNQVEVASENQIYNVQTYQLVPIIQSTPIHTVPVYQTLTSSPMPPRSLKPKTTLKPTTQSQPPCSEATKPYPRLRIRMSSPRGVTNITINPASATKRQTTKNPKETSRRQNRSDYDECVKTCGDGKKRVCAAPSGARPVDPDVLRGFPSICHLACHNNFKSNKYEKLLDGRCGRLRTRIRPVDSTDKIKRTELNKLQYQIVAEPQTVIEFEPIA